MQAVLAQDEPLKSSELKPDGAETEDGLAAVSADSETGDSLDQSEDENLAELIEFMQPKKKERERGPKGSLLEQGLSAYEKVGDMELPQHYLGVNLKKAC